MELFSSSSGYENSEITGWWMVIIDDEYIYKMAMTDG